MADKAALVALKINEFILMALFNVLQTHADLSHFAILPPKGRGSRMVFSSSVVYISLITPSC